MMFALLLSALCPCTALDDAAGAALFRLEIEQVEHIGVLYSENELISHTAPVTMWNGFRVKAKISIPVGSLLALFHNHPVQRLDRSSAGASKTMDYRRHKFTYDDLLQAINLGVPSYISAGHTIMRYDPSTGRTEEVLAQIPLGEIRDKYME